MRFLCLPALIVLAFGCKPSKTGSQLRYTKKTDSGQRPFWGELRFKDAKAIGRVVVPLDFANGPRTKDSSPCMPPLDESHGNIGLLECQDEGFKEVLAIKALNVDQECYSALGQNVLKAAQSIVFERCTRAKVYSEVFEPEVRFDIMAD